MMNNCFLWSLVFSLTLCLTYFKYVRVWLPLAAVLWSSAGKTFFLLASLCQPPTFRDMHRCLLSLLLSATFQLLKFTLSHVNGFTQPSALVWARSLNRKLLARARERVKSSKFTPPRHSFRRCFVLTFQRAERAPLHSLNFPHFLFPSLFTQQLSHSF